MIGRNFPALVYITQLPFLDTVVVQHVALWVVYGHAIEKTDRSQPGQQARYSKGKARLPN